MKVENKQKVFLFLLLLILVAIGCIGMHYYFRQYDGSSIERREKCLDKSIMKDAQWHIVTETEIDGHIISGAYSTDHKAALAVFEPAKNGAYHFVTAKLCNPDEILTDHIILHEKAYDIIWFSGVETEYAAVTYTIDHQIQEPLRYDTTDMQILYHEAPSKEYSMDVSYYDHEGNRYE